MKTIFRFAAAAFLSAAFCISWSSCSQKETIRFIDYNIADGMWYDQYNGYDRFVDWMKTQDPDIFTICEGGTHWNESKEELGADALLYLPDSLSVLAKRWGHGYCAVGPYQDNYPVAVTSKYPIELVQRLGEGLSHGAVHVKIKGVNYVVVHLWPQPYSMGDETRSDNRGDWSREQEMRLIIDSTINNPRFSKEKYWVMTGDFNSYSPVDREYYEEDADYGAHTFIRENYDHDVIADMYPGQFIPSYNYSDKRIDFIYCSDGVFRKVLKSGVIKDDFTAVASDHLPVTMEFENPVR